MSRRNLFAFFATVALAVAGCSSSATNTSSGPTADATVREVVEMIRLYSGEANRGPTKPTDLYKYENGYPLGVAALKSGQVVLIAGATVAGEGGGGTEEVVAHEKNVPTDGGFVGLQNGSVKRMTAAEFAAAPKGGKK